MLAVRLIQLIETHATALVQAVIADIRSNPRTRSFTRVPEADLRDRLHDLYRHFGDWVGDRTETQIATHYVELGRRRYHEEVPLEEVIYALILIKDHLRGFIRHHGLAASVVEMYSEEQLYELTGSFFDRAMYFTVKGYEGERRRRADLAAAKRSLEPAVRPK
jgi:hypothetical protein